MEAGQLEGAVDLATLLSTILKTEEQWIWQPSAFCLRTLCSPEYKTTKLDNRDFG